MSERRVVSVSRLVGYLKTSMESDPVLSGVLVEGEISNLRQPYSGHWYFSLKDQNASLSCVMFASSNRRVTFPIKNGDKVVVRGNVSVYPAQGTLQLIVSAMRQSGIGDLYQQLELLKQKLSKEGLFDESHKKRLPLYPMNIALVTGNNTAAREDVLITFSKRWPAAVITEYPCPVQGTDAPPAIIQSLLRADSGSHDLILLVRGGGSIEDLWCFNDESLARVIYGLNTPIITGIGHEIDFTIADFTADYRANTPTGAVEAAVPDANEVSSELLHLRTRMITAVRRRMEKERETLDRCASHPVMLYPERLYTDQAIRLDYLREKLMKTSQIPAFKHAQLSELARRLSVYMHTCTKALHTDLYEQKMAMAISVKENLIHERSRLAYQKQKMNASIVRVPLEKEKTLAKNAALLDAYSPLKVMSRGYGIILKEEKVVRSVSEVLPNDPITVRISDGMIYAEAQRTEKTDGFDK